MQPEHQPEHLNDPRAAALGQRGGQKRLAQLTTQERSALAKHAARARWHPLEAKARRERAEAVRRLAQQQTPHTWREVAGVQPDLGHFDLIGDASGLPSPIRSWADLDRYLPAQPTDEHEEK